jgi:hypothetical protein
MQLVRTDQSIPIRMITETLGVGKQSVRQISTINLSAGHVGVASRQHTGSRWLW